MSVIRATVHNGKLIADAPAGWPEGKTVDLMPVEERWGISEDEWDDSPEGIESWLRWYDAIEPLILTPEDEARIAEVRRQDREYFLAQADKRDRKLREMFE